MTYLIPLMLFGAIAFAALWPRKIETVSRPPAHPMDEGAEIVA